MREVLYIEAPTPDIAAVRQWLQNYSFPSEWQKLNTPDGIKLQRALSPSLNSRDTPTPNSIPQSLESSNLEVSDDELDVFVWTVQRTTYLKVFSPSSKPLPGETALLQQLQRGLSQAFPPVYPAPPKIDLSNQSIFEALAPYYPETVRFFQKMPNGEYDLNRVYWWEMRWRDSVNNPQTPKQVIFKQPSSSNTPPTYDLIYIGGALGVIHAAVMAQMGYRVLLVERLPFGRMNREWNISRSEFQSLIDLGLFTPAEFENIIAREYVDGFHKFFDGNNPPHLKAEILHTPTVLNVALDAEKLLKFCGDKLKAAGGEIWDETEFVRANISPQQVEVQLTHLGTQETRTVTGKLLVDAMGTASPIAWQLNGGRTFDSVCPTVGAVVKSGFAPEVWDTQYGDVLNSHGDISRGRQLIWELFPAENDELTIYLFHYHQVHPENPGSLLEMYEDFFTILPEYRRCEMEVLEWKKATFGYIPGHFSVNGSDRTVAFDRLISIGDAASLQSPLVFTGFGSLVRNLSRLTDLLDTALRHNLLAAQNLNLIRAYQSNISVTWLFSKGMMVPTGRVLPPQRINSMLNTFFGLLATEPPEVADTFIKDRVSWLTFNRLALKAATINPALLLWIWDLAGPRDIFRWLGSYVSFTLGAITSFLFGWFPDWLQGQKSWMEKQFPGLWLRLLAWSYTLTAGVGQPKQSHVKLKPRPAVVLSPES